MFGASFCFHHGFACFLLLSLRLNFGHAVTQSEPTTWTLRELQARLLPCGSQVAISLADSSGLVGRTQEKCPREHGAGSSLLNPSFVEANPSLRDAIGLSHQFLHQQNGNCPRIMVLNFVVFDEVL